MIDFHRMTPLRAFDLRSMRQLDELLQEATTETLGWRPEEWRERWRPSQFTDKTARPWCAPRTELLFDEWRARREPSWLYSHPEYVMDPLACGVMDLTPKNLREGSHYLAREVLFDKSDDLILADLGAGPGVTTVILAKTFPRATIHWVEINNESRKLAEFFARRAGVFDRIVWGGPLLDEYDVVFALELVEHLWTGVSGIGDPFSSPYSDAIERTNAVVQATAWTAELGGWSTLGHFLEYEIDDVVVPVQKAKRAFYAGMRKRHFELKFEGFNGTPGVWTK